MNKLDFIFKNFDHRFFLKKYKKFRGGFNLELAQLLLDSVFDIVSIREKLIFYKFFKGKEVPKEYKKFLFKYKKNFSDNDIRKFFVKTEIRNEWHKEEFDQLSHYINVNDEFQFKELIGDYLQSGEFFRKLPSYFKINFYAIETPKNNNNWMQAYSLKENSSNTIKIIQFDFGRATPANDRCEIRSNKILKLFLNYKVSEAEYMKAYRNQLKKRNFEAVTGIKINKKKILKTPLLRDKRLALNLNDNKNYDLFFKSFINDKSVIKNYINENPEKYFPKLNNILKNDMDFIVETLKEFWKRNPSTAIKNHKFYKYIMSSEFKWCTNKTFIDAILYSCDDIEGLIEYIPIKIKNDPEFKDEIKTLKMFRTTNKKFIIKIFKSNLDKLEQLTEHYMPTTILNDEYLMTQLLKLNNNLMLHVGDKLKNNVSFKRKIQKIIFP